MVNSTLSLIPEEVQSQSASLVAQIKSGSFRCHSLRDDTCTARKLGVYLEQYKRYLHTKNFAMIVACDGS